MKKIVLFCGNHTTFTMTHLTLEQRYKIEAYRNLGKGISEISEYIGKDKSFVSRELKRNSDGRSGLYKANLAYRKTVLRHKTKKKNTRFSQQMQDYVLCCLIEYYSPEQIVGRAKLECMEMVSHERICQHI
ncbi:helix-turn-helix domain-containing protein [uncultured Chryseobacterium sp.]|uniref:helix-turn-helix domain-containing protein n=2 Tax=uncultured Chryseobacterium sp. TaxID=259322 RepID=UPI0025EB44F3|nr:helix-turn-helix domain-containing protein [uncultured Chryseobacterium sp.]